MKFIIVLILLSISLISVSTSGETYNPDLEEYKNKIIEKYIESGSDTCQRKRSHLLFLPIGRQDSLEKFFCEAYEKNIKKLPNKGTTTIKPWSGWYWPIKYGILSVRYNTNDKNTIGIVNSSGSGFSKTFTYKESVSKYKQPEEHNQQYNTPTFEEYVRENYSPAEKYDLLLGDYQYTLTNEMKDEGKSVKLDESGDVPGWYGICHGWTPASVLVKRPRKIVKLTAADGKTNIEFLPEDIKALASLFYSKANFKTKFVGTRCDYTNLDEVPKDPDTGLFIDPNCSSVNPASLMLALGNQIGIKKDTMIYNPDTNGEVWNQPVYGYEFSYYNYLTKKSGDLLNSKILFKNLKQESENDKFIKFYIKRASKNVKSIVGVKLRVNFVFENFPMHSDARDKNNDKIFDYNFILELDSNDEIVGGEWTTNKHANFIWTHEEHDKIVDEYDPNGIFSGKVEELKNLFAKAKKGSENGTVLKSIVDYLAEQSADKEN